jgi:hypothetical protein
MNCDGNILAYVAGVMDGDGSFSLIKRRGCKSPLYFPMMQLANEHECLIDLFVSMFGGRRFVRTKLAKTSKKVSYNWKIEKKNMSIPFLESVSPYLIIKKERAEFLLAFCLNHEFKRGAGIINAYELISREKAYLKMMSMNSNPNINSNLKVNSHMNESIDFWSYFAGLMDTDGSFSLKRENRKSGGSISPVYTPTILLSQYDSRAIYHVSNNFIGSNLMVIKAKSVKSGFCYRFSITSKKHSIEFLKRIIPFLVIKKEQAQVLLDYSLNIKRLNDRSSTTQEEIKLRDKYYHKIVSLNKYGVYKPSLIDLEARRGDRAEALISTVND